MPTRQIFASQYAKELKLKVLKAGIEHYKPLVIKDATSILNVLYDQTFIGWNGGKGHYVKHYSKEFIFPEPKVTFEEVFSKVQLGFRLAIYSLVTFPDGKRAHNLWYWIDRGTRAVVQQKTSPEVYATQQRTYGSKYPKPFSGFASNTFAVPAGVVRKGIDPQNWSQKIADDFVRELNSRGGILGGLPGFTVAYRTPEPQLRRV